MLAAPLIQMLNNYGREGKNNKIRGTEVAALLRKYETILDFISDFNSNAISEPLDGGKPPLTHKRLREFLINEFNLCQYGLNEGERVSILLPNGPELAVTMIAVLTKWCAAPINSTNTWQEIKAELISTQAKAIIILAGASANEAALQAADSIGIGVLVINPIESVTGLFRLTVLREVPRTTRTVVNRVADVVEGFKRYDHPETVLLLHTSGTSGNKKLVPYSLDMVVIGVGCIISSWNLSNKDVCLNMVNHIIYPLFY
jgi:acyl-coenzyme A synthetase/AMP-(fatty) acid ligase